MVDDRLPGVAQLVRKAYECPKCGLVVRDVRQPECPVDHVLMTQR